MSFDSSNSQYHHGLEQQQQYKSAYGPPPFFSPVSQHNSMAIPLLTNPPIYQQGLVQQQPLNSDYPSYQHGLPQQQPQQYKSAYSLPALAPALQYDTSSNVYNMAHQQNNGQQQSQPPQHTSSYSLPAIPPASQNYGIADQAPNVNDVVTQQSYGQQPAQQYISTYGLPALLPAPPKSGIAVISFPQNNEILRQDYGQLPQQPKQYQSIYGQSVPAPQNGGMAATTSIMNNSLFHHRYGQQQPQPQQYKSAYSPPAPQNDDLALSSSNLENTVPREVYGQIQGQRVEPQAEVSAPVIDGMSTVAVDHEDQSKHLWYWVEIIKPITFHDSCLNYQEASRLATLYLSKLPQDTILPSAQSSTTLTLLHESATFLRYQILGVLFPLMRRWVSSHEFRTTIARSTRIQRLSLWRSKALTEPESLNSYLEVLDPMLDRKWIHSDEHGGNANTKSMRMKMQGYLLAKFVLNADLVYLELMMKFNVEPYNRQRFHYIHYNAMLPKLMAVNCDPYIIPYLFNPPYWPATTRVDEDVMLRCVALLGRSLD